jgi:hypothetical protein
MHDPSEAIRRQGYAVLDVEPDLGADPPRPGYAITVGLIERGRSNLLILGLPSPTSRMILVTLADHGLHHEPLPLNAPLAGFFDGLEPVLRPLDESSAAAWLNRPHPLDAAPIGKSVGLSVGLNVGWSKDQQLHGWASSGPLPGDRARLLQVVWPDASGHYPWEAEFDDALRPAQPLLKSD